MKYTLLESKILLFCMFRMLRLILMEYPEENKVSERGKKHHNRSHTTTADHEDRTYVATVRN